MSRPNQINLKLSHDALHWGVDTFRNKMTEQYDRLKLYLVNQIGDPSYTIPESTSISIVDRESFAESVAKKLKSTSFEGEISTNILERFLASKGQSYVDLIELYHPNSKAVQIPDIVATPKTGQDLQLLLKFCHKNNIVLTPLGGATNVVNAFSKGDENREWLVANLSKLNKLISIDQENGLVILQAGITGSNIINLLNPLGYTIGHYPQSIMHSTLGGWLSTLSSGQESNFYGSISTICTGLKVLTPSGILQFSHRETSAEGPDLKTMFLGAEGTLGIIEEATLKIHKNRGSTRWIEAIFPDFKSGIEAVKLLKEEHLTPDIFRLQDLNEVVLYNSLEQEKRSEHVKAKLCYFGKSEILTAKHQLVSKCLKELASSVTTVDVESTWQQSRFALPYLRDFLLEDGYFIETFECEVLFTKCAYLHESIHNQCQDYWQKHNEKGIVLCHVSHIHHTTCGIYFTVISLRNTNSPREQWKAISDIFLAAFDFYGTSITHHHSLGNRHKEMYLKRMGTVQYNLLYQIKEQLDPNNILNPGLLNKEE